MRVSSSFRVIGLGAAVALTLTPFAPRTVLAAPPEGMERVTVPATGEQASGASGEDVEVSADGQYVAFISAAPNLIPDDTNGETDVFVKDRTTGIVDRVSVSTGEGEGYGESFDAIAMTPDGRYVAFGSRAQLTSDPTYASLGEVYLRDRTERTTELVSRGMNGQPSEGTSGYGTMSITDDGRYILFESWGNNLAPRDTNEEPDLFLFDRTTQMTKRVNVSNTEEQASQGFGQGVVAVASDGHVVVAFNSFATNLVADGSGGGVFLRDITAGTTERLVPASLGANALVFDLSADARFLVFGAYADPSDGATLQVHVLDRTTGAIEMISVNSAGEPGIGSQEEGGSFGGTISGDGRFVAFGSAASNLVGGDTNALCGNELDGFVNCPDAFVHDRLTGSTTRRSISDTGAQGNHRTYGPDISRDGGTLAFLSYASTLVPNDTNDASDVFAQATAFPPESATEVAPPGGTVEAGGAPNAAQPVSAAVTTPQGGLVSISVEQATESPDPGFTFFGQQVDISAPEATASDPLELYFRIDRSLIPPGVAPGAVDVFRTEGTGEPVRVPGCSATDPSISPDPCVASRAPRPDDAQAGDAFITVLTSRASIWNFGVVREDPPAGDPEIVIGNVTVTEGDSTVYARFTVSLSARSDRVVRVDFATQHGTARSADYVSKSGTRTFQAGETRKRIAIAIKGENLREDTEHFFVNLSRARNATIADGRGRGTIRDDDPDDPLVVLTKTGPTEAAAGERISYRLSYRNLGPFASRNARMRDLLPPELRFISATGGGVYNATSHVVRWDLGTVEVDESRTFTVTVKVRVNTPSGTRIVNQVEFKGDATTATPAVSVTRVR